ncbi:MAG: hypothetical protein HQM10_13695 [Candidatus Riflebacteria bacterium]|nr:hypothetical protein [Candidatus Riflebacteria bacterium]
MNTIDDLIEKLAEDIDTLKEGVLFDRYTGSKATPVRNFLDFVLSSDSEKEQQINKFDDAIKKIEKSCSTKAYFDQFCLLAFTLPKTLEELKDILKKFDSVFISEYLQKQPSRRTGFVRFFLNWVKITVTPEFRFLYLEQFLNLHKMIHSDEEIPREMEEDRKLLIREILSFVGEERSSDSLIKKALDFGEASKIVEFLKSEQVPKNYLDSDFSKSSLIKSTDDFYNSVYSIIEDRASRYFASVDDLIFTYKGSVTIPAHLKAKYSIIPFLERAKEKAISEGRNNSEIELIQSFIDKYNGAVTSTSQQICEEFELPQAADRLRNRLAELSPEERGSADLNELRKQMDKPLVCVISKKPYDITWVKVGKLLKISCSEHKISFDIVLEEKEKDKKNAR